MKRYAILALLLLTFLGASAQGLSVRSFEWDPNDLTARTHGTAVEDQNGYQCALIKIETTERGQWFFDVGMLGVTNTEMQTPSHPAEIWVYVPFGVNKIKIQHEVFGSLEYRFPCDIEKGCTYVMQLDTDKPGPGPLPSVRQQFLLFQITPPNATLEVNGELWEVDADGNAMQYVYFGTYTYRVRAANYFSDTGKVTVDDPDNTRIVKVDLKPDYAEVTLAVDADAEIWVNGERKGVRTWTGRLGRGTYKIECKQQGHETSVTSQTITADMNRQTINLPAPTPIYGSLNVESSPKICTLYIDGQAMGETPKSINKILIGQHEIRLTKEGYADYTETVTIVRDERKQVKATLSNGQEIQFTCNVPNAQLSIDGNPMGSTSGSYLLTYGNHNLKATADGYQDYTGTLNVTENIRRHSITMRSKPTAPVGAVEGMFSVSPDKQVYFSKGNLQYQASTKTWRFAEHQYDIIGNNNGGISSRYSGWIDLFGWGTSGYGNKYPYMTSTTSTDYGNGNNDIAGTQYDWGVHNAISNGGNQAGLWRTLTKDEWVYVFNTRSTTSGIRYAKACVNGMNGVILLPDDWSTSYYNLSNTNNSGASFSSNTISASQWTTLEQHGAVFLPAAGYRGGTSVNYVGSYGDYWSASYNGSYSAYSVYFNDSYLGPQSYYDRRYLGRSVRLVRSAQ